jgi:hypothetical protein
MALGALHAKRALVHCTLACFAPLYHITPLSFQTAQLRNLGVISELLV